MGILEQLVALMASLNALQTQLADAQVALEVATKEAYDKGFVDGVASVPVKVVTGVGKGAVDAVGGVAKGIAGALGSIFGGNKEAASS